MWGWIYNRRREFEVFELRTLVLELSVLPLQFDGRLRPAICRTIGRPDQGRVEMVLGQLGPIVQ